ncbi:MAG: quinol oxidase [Phycisphaerae bacterium]
MDPESASRLDAPDSQPGACTSALQVNFAALLATPIRWVVGWLYFSAFWRRVVLENKLDPDAAGYVGEKFNHFLPHAILIKPVIAFFVSHPTLLFWKLIAFTAVEAVVGLGLMLGLMTRLAGIGVSALALGILLGAGWLGTTCLDEWQIGVMGVVCGLLVVFTGGGPVSVDHAMVRVRPSLGQGKWFAPLASGHLRLFDRPRGLTMVVVVISAASLLLTLWTNQVFHGGVYGQLHNKSVAPHVTIYEAALQPEGVLRLRLMRDQGPDVYGSFVIGVSVRAADGAIVEHFDGAALAALAPEAIKNWYVARVRPGEHSLILPLGALAELRLASNKLENLAGGEYRVEIEDISGRSWSAPVQSGAPIARPTSGLWARFPISGQRESGVSIGMPGTKSGPFAAATTRAAEE